MQANLAENSAQRHEVCLYDRGSRHVHYQLQNIERKLRGNLSAGTPWKDRRSNNQQLSVKGDFWAACRKVFYYKCQNIKKSQTYPR
jgi:hypothetical protein